MTLWSKVWPYSTKVLPYSPKFPKFRLKTNQVLEYTSCWRSTSDKNQLRRNSLKLIIRKDGSSGLWASLLLRGRNCSQAQWHTPTPTKKKTSKIKANLFSHTTRIHKKIPTLVHNGKKPRAESLVMLEYIGGDMEGNFLSSLVYYLNTGSRAREGDQGDEGEQPRTSEEGAGKGLKTKEQFFPGNEPEMLDFVMGSSTCWLIVLVKLTSNELAEEETTPILSRRLKAFEEVQVIKETPPQHEKLMPHAKNVRRKVLGSKED